MPELHGWMLDLFEDQEEGLILYFITTDGQRLRLHQDFPIVFYAQGQNSDLRALWRFLSTQPNPPKLRRETRSNVFTRQDETVLTIEAQNAYAQHKLFQNILQRFPNLTYANVDIQLSLRYAAATGVFPTAHCAVEFDENHTLLRIRPLEESWDIASSKIPLQVMSITPDNNPLHAQPKQLFVEIAGESCHLDLEPELSLLINLRALLRRHDPDLLLTDWGDTWLLPKLIEAAQKHGIPLPLNRENKTEIRWQKERTFFSYGQIVYRGQQIQLFGRCHIDRRNAALWDDYQLDGALEACRITSLPLQTSARTSPGTGISSIEILTALREGILVPWQKQQAEMIKPASELFLSDQGGLVFQPEVGVHKHVAEIDFVSLYPAIMVNFNISPETILPDPTADNLVPTLGIAIDNSKMGIVPKALKPLLLKRILLKIKLSDMLPWNPLYNSYTHRASALKWLLVTCFGYLGYKNARFGRIEAHQAVTAYSREILLRAKETAEEAGFDVLHLYVDALWVRQKGKQSPESFQDLLVMIQQRTSMPITLDGVYRWLVFVPSRQNINRPVPNRYFGLFQDGVIKVRGIDARRHDTTPFISHTQMHILTMLADYKNPQEALTPIIRYLKTSISKLHNGEVPLEDLIVKRRLGRELNVYRALPAAARAAKQLESIGKYLRPGQRVSFIHMLGNPGVHAWDLPTPPDPAGIDKAYYQELIMRAASTVLQPWVGSEERLREIVLKNSQQLRLPRVLLKHPLRHKSLIAGEVSVQFMVRSG
ncbi:MAG: hypothetical protein MUO40_14670 [Anaerolineaceae bacterium]|nr:hypothetical protein [Anaerolineaceae bacterium]